MRGADIGSLAVDEARRAARHVVAWRGLSAQSCRGVGVGVRSALTDVAEVYKEFFDGALLKNAQAGVDYFLQFLRPKFIKGASNIFLGRLISFWHEG